MAGISSEVEKKSLATMNAARLYLILGIKKPG